MFILGLIATLCAVCGITYYVLCLVGARAWLHRAKPPLGFAPAASILKPVRGTDPEMYESFRSHCLQDYSGEYELIFGVHDPNDAAVPLVRRLQQEFPERRIELVTCPQVLGTNRKVSNLIQMLPHARHSYLLIDDSDIRLERAHLQIVMAPFADSQVGMVTALYRGIADRTLGSRLESIGISAEFTPGVLVARLIERGVHFALGSTLAFPLTTLEKIGGLEPLLDYLADDFELGARTSAAGLRVEFAGTVVENYLPPYTMRDFLQHQLRWGRSTRESRPAGYTGVLLTFGLPWALLAFLLTRSNWSLALFAIAVALRFAVAVTYGQRVVADAQLHRDLPLVLLRDFFGLIVWMGSYLGNTVTWRGEKFKLKDGKLLSQAQ